MGKQRKHILTLEYEYDYEMLGICSHHGDYRLVWGINDKLKLQLEKANDDFVAVNKKGQHLSRHSLYEFVDNETQVEYYLVKNKNEGKLLIPEKQEIDYFLFVKEIMEDKLADFIPMLKAVSSVLAVYRFNPEELNSTENLAF